MRQNRPAAPAADPLRLTGVMTLSGGKSHRVGLALMDGIVLLSFLAGICLSLRETIGWEPEWYVWPGIGLSALLITAVWRMGRHRLWAIPLLAAVWALVAVWLFPEWIGGARGFLFGIVSAMNHFLHTVLTVDPYSGLRAEKSIFFVLFLLPAALLAGGIIRRRNWWGLLLVAVPWIWVAANLDARVETLPLILLFVSVLMTYAMRRSLGHTVRHETGNDFATVHRRRASWHYLNRTSRKNQAMAQGAFCVAAAALVAGAAASAILPRERYTWKDTAWEIAGEAAAAVEKWTGPVFSGSFPLLPFGGGTSGMSSGSLGRLGEISYTDQEMLRILTISREAELYLKGYVGSVYRGNRWDELPADVYPEGEWSRAQVLGGAMAVMNAEWDSCLLDMTILNVNAGTQYLFHPYGTYPIRYADDFLHRDSWISGSASGSGVYRLTAVSNPLYGISPVYSDILGEEVPSISAAEQREWRQQEADYYRFVQENYLDVPEAGLERFHREYTAASYAGLSLSGIIEKVREDVSRDCRYSLSPGRTPWGADFVEDFLYDRQQGFCVHFASAAVLMFRTAGVPARYVEGYVVREEDYADMEAQGGVVVRDRAAHAWPEIYVQGIGWIPVEVTPGFSGGAVFLPGQAELPPASSELVASQPESSDRSESSATVSSQPAAGSEAVGPELSSTLDGTDPGGAAASAERFEFPWQILWLLLVPGLPAAALALRHRWGLERRQKALAQPDPNRAALEAYGYLCRLLEYEGIRQTAGQAPQEFACAAEAGASFLQSGEFSQATQIALAARFGGEQLTASEVRPILELCQRADRRLFSRLSRRRRWLYCYWYNLHLASERKAPIS